MRFSTGQARPTHLTGIARLRKSRKCYDRLSHLVFCHPLIFPSSSQCVHDHLISSVLASMRISTLPSHFLMRHRIFDEWTGWSKSFVVWSIIKARKLAISLPSWCIPFAMFPCSSRKWAISDIYISCWFSFTCKCSEISQQTKETQITTKDL